MELLVSLKNTAKHRYFYCVTNVRTIQDDLRTILSAEDMLKIEELSKKAREAMFTRSKERQLGSSTFYLDYSRDLDSKVRLKQNSLKTPC